MTVLPENTILGKLQIVEVYDKPLLFTCRNASNNLYLAVLEEETETHDSWWYAGISPLRLQQVRSGVIDLYDAFKKTEDSFVLQVKIEHKSSESHVEFASTDRLSEEQLPTAGERLDLDSDTLDAKVILIDKKAPELVRDYMTAVKYFLIDIEDVS
ncbi:MAG: DUF6575 domain-containing protein [Aggregatilineales bacterium]